MRWVKRVMERGQPPVAAPYATTPNGAPFPLRSWPPDTAIDIQNLATWADTYLYSEASGYLAYGGSLPSGTTRLATVSGSPLLSGPANWVAHDGAGRLTVTKAGVYAVTGTVGINAVARGQVQVKCDAPAVTYSGTWTAGVTGIGSSAILAANIRANAGAKFELWMWSEAAAGIAADQTGLSVRWIGA